MRPIPRFVLLVLFIFGFIVTMRSAFSEISASPKTADILEDRKIVFMVAEQIYDTDSRLRQFSASTLQPLRVDSIFIAPDPDDSNSFPGLVEALETADLLLISVRRRALPEEQIDALRNYIYSGRPVIGIRTASHAFDTKGRARSPYMDWPDFGEDIFGVKYKGHGRAGLEVVVTPASEEVATHPILADSAFPYSTSDELYRAGNPKGGVETLLAGTAAGGEIQMVAWTYVTDNTCAFYTSLVDLEDKSYRSLLVNAMRWVLSTGCRPGQ